MLVLPNDRSQSSHSYTVLARELGNLGAAAMLVDNEGSFTKLTVIGLPVTCTAHSKTS